MTEPLTTPNRKLTWEEEMAWPRRPEPRQEDVEDDIMLDMIQPATPPGQPPAPPHKIDLERVRETLDEQAFQLHCQGLSYRKIGQTLQKPPSTVHKMVKRHNHRQRDKYYEHPADVRDELTEILKQAAYKVQFDTNKENKKENIQALKALIQYSAMRLKLLKIPNPTVAGEFLRKLDYADSLPACDQTFDAPKPPASAPAPVPASKAPQPKCEHPREQPGVHTAQVVEKPAVAPSAEKNANSVNTTPVATASAPNPGRNEQQAESLISQLRTQCEHKRTHQGVHGAQHVEKPPVARRKKKRKPSVNTRPEYDADEEEFGELT